MIVMTLFKTLIVMFIFWLWSCHDYDGSDNGGNNGDDNDEDNEYLWWE